MTLTPIAQLRDNPPPRSLVVGAVAAVVIVALLAGVYFAFFQTRYAVLFSNLKTADAAAVVADLDKKHIAYRLADKGATILVPADKVDATRLDVVSEDLPIKGMVGFELFNKSDMGLTEFAQKINYQRALQGELARTIMSIDGIDNARVHLSMPDPTLFRDDKRAPKASATLIARPGRTLSLGTIAGVGGGVAPPGSAPAPSHHVILDQQGNVVSGDATGPAPPTNPDQAEERSIEAFYAARVRRALAATLPNAEVNVTIPTPLSVGAAPTAAAPPWAGWTPEARRFGLVVAVNPGKALTDTEQTAARALAASAIGVFASITDRIDLTTAPLAAAEPAATEGSQAVVTLKPVQPVQIAGPRATGGAASFMMATAMVVLSILAAAAIVLAVMGRRRSQARARLSEEEREEIAGRFKSLLAEGRS